MTLLLLAVGMFAAVIALLVMAVWAERRMHVAAARMVVDDRWSPEDAEAIVAKELAGLFIRQDAVRVHSRPRWQRVAHGH